MKATRQVEEYLMKQKDIKRYFVAVGGFGGGAGANSSNLFVTLHDRKDRPIDPATGKSLHQTDL